MLVNLLFIFIIFSESVLVHLFNRKHYNRICALFGNEYDVAGDVDRVRFFDVAFKNSDIAGRGNFQDVVAVVIRDV